MGLKLDPIYYHLNRLRRLSTPRLVVFRQSVDKNIEQMRSYLQEIIPESGFRHLVVHAKTHKSKWVSRRLLEAGVRKFKCTFNELDTLLEAGAPDIFVAYPALPHDADRLARRVREQGETRIAAQVGSLVHAGYLQSAAERHEVYIPCFLDLDVGQHRTWVREEQLLALARAISREGRFSKLRICGLHAYDGHNQSPNPNERQALARQCMDQVARCWQALSVLDLCGDRIIVSGTPPFRADLRELIGRHEIKAQVEVSPGTWVYWDTKYDGIIPGLFEYAALVLAQVIDLPGDDLVTINAGYKRWGIDQGPIELFSVPGLEFVSGSEEHAVLRRSDAPRLAVGDHLLLAPRHVCSTVNLWAEFTLVGADGRIIEESLPVSARNR